MVRSLSKKESLSVQTAKNICRYIEEKEIPVGAKLPNEFQLAEICNVSRSTIRDAIKQLNFEGRVEVVRGSGTFVSEPNKVQPEQPADYDPIKLQENMEIDTIKTALDYMDVRLMLEPEVASLAAANANYSDCQRLMEIHKELAELIEKDEDHLQVDILFHNQIAACTHNNIVCNLMEIVSKGIPIFGEATRNTFANDTVKEHNNIMKSIIAGDTLGAKYYMITHINGKRNFFLDAREEGKKSR